MPTFLYVSLFATAFITFMIWGTYWCFRHGGLAGIFGWAFTVFIFFYATGSCVHMISSPLSIDNAAKYGWGGEKGKDKLIDLYPELDRSKLPDEADAQRSMLLSRMEMEEHKLKNEQVLTDRENLKRYESLGMSQEYWHEKYMYLTSTDVAWRQYCERVWNSDRKSWEGQWKAAKIKKDDVKASLTEEARKMYKAKG